MPIAPRKAPALRVVEILAFEHANVLDITGPLQVFTSANEWVASAGKPHPYACSVVARHSPVITSSGLSIVAQALPSSAGVLDTLMVAGGSGVHPACRDPVLVRWLKARSRHARRIASVCTGAFLLGEAGLLEGRRAVTHWFDCATLANRFKGTTVEVDPIFIRDGRVWTSAGVTAGIDLSLSLVEEDLGHRAAVEVARQLVVFLKRPGGQAQFSNALCLQASDLRFDQLHAWIADHLSADLSVKALADRAAMSERTFIRRYRNATGLSPAKAVERIRMEAAQRLLTETPHSIKRIARACGFGTEETMRQCFQRLLSVSPSDFRVRFSGA